MTTEEKFVALTDEYTHLMGKYQMMKADYENQLKNDLVAMLTEIQTEIDELYSYVEFDDDMKTSFNMIRLEEVQRVIDKYKEEEE